MNRKKKELVEEKELTEEKEITKDEEHKDEYDSPWKDVIQKYLEDASKVGFFFSFPMFIKTLIGIKNMSFWIVN